MRMLLPFGLILLVLSGCATATATARWVRPSGELRHEKGNFAVAVPEGWIAWQNTGSGRIAITRDGFPLQQILVGRITIKEAMQNAKRRFEPGMLPQETAEIVADDFASNKRMSNFRVLENAPATVAGHPAFRLTFTYTNEAGLRGKDVYCGFLTGEWFYFLRFSAAERHYFDRDRPAFDNVVRSFRLVGGPG